MGIKRKEFIKRLKKWGFTGPFSGGKHQFLTKGKLKLTIPNPHHQDIELILLKKLLKQAGISYNEWKKK